MRATLLETGDSNVSTLVHLAPLRALAALLATFACTGPLAAQLLRESAEPNALGAVPTPLPCGAQVEGTIDSATDADAYTIALASPAILAAWTSPGRAGAIAGTVLEVRDAQGALLRMATGGGARGTFAALELGLPPGTFHLVVRGANGARGTYALDARPTTAPPLLVEDPEPNGAPAAGGRPTVATVDALADGVIGSATDTDWYSVVPGAPLLLEASVERGLGAPLAEPVVRLWVQGPSGLVLDAQDSGAGSARLHAPLGAAGGFVEVAAARGGTGSYLLVLRATAAADAATTGCPGSAGVPWLDVRRGENGEALELPVLGSTYVVDGGNAPPGAAVVRLVGLHGAIARTLLAPLGGGDCALAVDPFAADFALADAAGEHRLAIPLPGALRWRGQAVTVQAAVLDAGANALGIAMSGALTSVCGTAL